MQEWLMTITLGIIGAFLIAVTYAALNQNKKSKQKKTIEFDAKLAKTLSEKYKESKKVQIIEMDFLKYKIFDSTTNNASGKSFITILLSPLSREILSPKVNLF